MKNNAENVSELIGDTAKDKPPHIHFKQQEMEHTKLCSGVKLFHVLMPVSKYPNNRLSCELKRNRQIIGV